VGFVSSIIGAAGGANGTGFSSPSSANILNPSTVGQAQEQYSIANTAEGQQMNLLNALQAQNGVQNQSNVFNQLQGVANGTGPNPAQAMLAQSTGANTANQAALMAGQRGSGANAGLIARQAAQQGAANQQQAAGQAATMQAQQSLNALNQLGGIAGQQVAQQQQATQGFNQVAQGEQQNILNSIGQQNNANVNMQSNINSANAGLAQTEMGAQNNLLGNATGAAGSALNFLKAPAASAARGGYIPEYANGGYTYNPDNLSSYPQITLPDQGVLAPATPSLSPTSPQTDPNAPKSMAGKTYSPNWNIGNTSSQNQSSNQPQGTGILGQQIGNAIGQGLNYLFKSSPTPMTPNTGNVEQTSLASNQPDMAMSARGGKVPALVSPGEVYLKPKDVEKVAKGKKDPMDGEKIPGKPKVKGAVNSYANDTVKRNLDEGGIVIPRSITQGKNPHWEAMKFVHATMRKLK